MAWLAHRHAHGAAALRELQRLWLVAAQQVSADGDWKA